MIKMKRDFRNLSQKKKEKFKKEVPEELRKNLDNPNIIDESSTELDESQLAIEKAMNDKTKKPSNAGGTTSDLQKAVASRNMKAYHEKLKRGEIDRNPFIKHGAFSFMKKGKIPKHKKHLMEFVMQERGRWVIDLGGEEDLSYLERSLLDEATRLLLYCTMINEHLLENTDKNSIVFKDKESGEIKMHSAISRTYLTFTKSYMGILKDLNKMVFSKDRVKRGGKEKDSASKLQELMKDKYKE